MLLARFFCHVSHYITTQNPNTALTQPQHSPDTALEKPYIFDMLFGHAFGTLFLPWTHYNPRPQHSPNTALTQPQRSPDTAPTQPWHSLGTLFSRKKACQGCVRPVLGLCQGCVGAVSGLCWGCVGVLGCNGKQGKKACQTHVQKACQKCRAFQGLCQGCARAVLVAGDRA